MIEIHLEGERSSPALASSAHPQTLVVGLGNPLLGDDGVGWRVAERLQASLAARQPALTGAMDPLSVEVDCLALGGLSLMERLIGYHRAIIIDVIATHKNPPGTVTCISLEDLPGLPAGHTGSAHDTSLTTAIEVGRLMGAELPGEIMLVAVEAETCYDVSDKLTPLVEAAVPVAEQAVWRILQARSCQSLS